MQEGNMKEYNLRLSKKIIQWNIQRTKLSTMYMTLLKQETL